MLFFVCFCFFLNIRPLYIRLLQQDGLDMLIFPSPFTSLRLNTNYGNNNCRFKMFLTVFEKKIAF